MIHVLLLRHAKSSWANPEIDDIDRPLNKRGKRGARGIGRWLQAQHWAPDTILCSPARRTRETCEGLGLRPAPVIANTLYEAEAETIIARLREAEGETILLIGHNPGIAEAAHRLAATRPDHPRFDDYPTAALLALRFEIDTPADIEDGAGAVVAFLTPHDLPEP